MTRKGLAMASAAIVTAMSLAAIVVAIRLPPDLLLPTHWGVSGPDEFSDKWTALLMPPAITAAVSLLFYVLPSLEPRGEGLSRSQGLYLWGWGALLLISVVIQLAVISMALRWGLPPYRLVVGGVGIAFALIGNQVGKSRRMYMIGLRTPWTLASEEVWIKTHRLAGKLMVAAGALCVIAAALPLPLDLLGTIVIAAIAIAAGVPTVYSFFAWRQERQAAQSSGYRSTTE